METSGHGTAAASFMPEGVARIDTVPMDIVVEETKPATAEKVESKVGGSAGIAGSQPESAPPGAANLPYLPPQAAAGIQKDGEPAGRADIDNAAAQDNSQAATTPAPSTKPARAQKTPYQKGSLEAAFRLTEHPNEEMKRALGQRIGLTEQQVGTWFQHRRQRKRRDAEKARERSGGEEVSEAEGDVGLASGAPEDLYQLLEAAARSLPVAYVQNDGPPLGFAFDDPPGPELGPEEFASTSILGGAAAVAEAETLAQSSGKKRRLTASEDEGGARKRSSLSGAKPPRPPSASVTADLERLRAEDEARAALLAEKARLQLERLDANLRREQERLARERERADSRMAKEREKELARLEAERRRHLERTQKELKREEERRAKEETRLRAAQEREEKRAALQADKERRAEERKVALAARRKEKDQQRMLQAQEKAALRLRARDFGTGPPDDLDVEWESLLQAYKLQHDLTDEDVAGLQEGDAPPRPGLPALPERAPWPPERVTLIPALSPRLLQGGALIESWSFVNAFAGELGLAPFSLDDLILAVSLGRRSRLLAHVHCSLLRTLQADAEESWAAGPAGVYGGLESAQASARLLEESWAWGFDPDIWRAHLNAATWPEVARQAAIAAGLGRPRPKKRSGERPKVGRLGEDVAADDSGSGGSLRLRLPPRLGLGTVKSAAWSVLAEAGAAGLKVDEIARRIQRRGLRDLRSSKTPEASVAGALGRDVLFQRVDLGTYALAAVVSYEAKMAARAADFKFEEGSPDKEEEGSEMKEGTRGVVQVVGEDGGDGLSAANEETKDSDNDDSEESESESESDESDSESEGKSQMSERAAKPDAAKSSSKEVPASAAGWLETLKRADYDSLSWEERASMLGALCYLTMQAPSVRDVMERRIEEQQRLKRQLWEDAKVEKRRRQIEAAQRLRAAAEAAQRAIEHKYKGVGDTNAAVSAAVSAAGAAPSAVDVEQDAVVSPRRGGLLKTEEGMGNTTPAEIEDHGSSPMDIDARKQEKQQDASRVKEEEETMTKPCGDAQTTPVSKESEKFPKSEPAQGGADVKTDEASASRDNNGALEAHVAAAEAIAAAERAAAEKEAADREAARQRQAQRSEQVLREIELCSVRMEPLGADRRYAHYWRLLPSSFGDESARSVSRVFVESEIDGTLRLLRDQASLEALMEELEQRGAREAGLYASLLRHKEAIVAGMPVETIDVPPTFEELDSELQARVERERTEDLQECAVTRAHHASGPAGNNPNKSSSWSPFAPGDSQEATRIKADLLRIKDAAQRAGVLNALFDASSWAAKLFEPGSSLDLRSRLAELEGSIAPEALSPQFSFRPRIVPGAWADEDSGATTLNSVENRAVKETAVSVSDDEAGATAAAELNEETQNGQHTLEWLPPTEASVALRVLSLDAALVGSDGLPPRARLPRYLYGVRPSADSAGVVLDQPLGPGGKARTVPFPPLPRKLLYGPTREFAFPQAQFLRDVANNSDGAIAIARPKGVGRGRGRGRGRGSALAAAEGRRLGVNRSGPRIVGSSKKERRAMLTQKSELAKEFDNSESDSERHYGTDFEEDPEFARQGLNANGARASVEPSVAGTEEGDEEALSAEEGSADEEISDDE